MLFSSIKKVGSSEADTVSLNICPAWLKSASFSQDAEHQFLVVSASSWSSSSRKNDCSLEAQLKAIDETSAAVYIR